MVDSKVEEEWNSFIETTNQNNVQKTKIVYVMRLCIKCISDYAQLTSVIGCPSLVRL